MRPLLSKILLFISVVVALLYVAASAAAYIHPANAWPLPLLALGYPVLALIIIMLATVWLFVKPRNTIIFLLVWLSGYKSFFSVFAFNTNEDFVFTKDINTLRIISWNVKGFDNNNKSAEHADSARRQMLNFIKEQQADVLLLQEFVEYTFPTIYSNTQVLSDTLGFKYHYTAKDLVMYKSYGPVVAGSAIFSKYQLHDTISMTYKNLSVHESAIGAMINLNGKQINLFTTHLQSMNLNKGNLDRSDAAYTEYDSAFIAGSSKTTKLVHYDQVHSNQALQLKSWMDSRRLPYIVSGDFNTVPSAFAYHLIAADLKDAFVEKGNGLGRTYTSLSPTLRIDYLLLNKQLNILQYKSPALYLSDHFPLVADVRWQ